MISQFQANDANNEYVKSNDYIYFDRNTFNQFTLIKINYDQSE